MEQRQSNKHSVAESIYVPAQRETSPQHGDSAPRHHVAGGGGSGGGSGANDGLSPQAHPRQGASLATASHAEKPNYLSKTSLLYIVCAGHLFLAVLYLAFYEQGSISRAYYEDLKVNLRPPWMLYRWLGSKGVDVTDLQWYYFVVALPPAAPYLIAFLFLSRRLRRYIAARPGTAASWVAAAAESANDFAGGDGKAAVSVNAESATSAFGHKGSHPHPQHGGAAVACAANGGGRGKGRDSPNASSSAAVAMEESLRLGSGFNASPLAPAAAVPASAAGSTATLLTRRNTAPLHVFHIFSGAIIAFCLSGPGILFGVVLMSLNFFCIAPLYKKLSFRACMAIMWITHVAVLFLNFHAGGYKFAWFGLSFLDDLWPPLIKWNVQYNMTILRMISFNNDLWESALYGEERREKALQKHERSCIACAQIRDQNRHAAATLPREAVSCYKCRTECCRAVPEFTFAAYLGYIFYLPLFMAGPLSSFNAYVSYMHYPQRSVIGAATWRYGLRWLGHALMLSTLMHYVHIMAMCFTPTTARTAAQLAGTAVSTGAAAATASVVGVGGSPDVLSPAVSGTPVPSAAARVVEALVEAVTGIPLTSTTAAPGPPVMELMSLPQKSVLFFLVLTFLWAKFDVIWRFFRFFALLDGFDPPEDMPRCFANTVNIQSFWRDWHASFNLWIVRYMYIPMGGSRTKLLSIFPIFFFIAIWHDIELRLLYWAFFICIGFIPEVVITLFFASKKNKIVLRIKQHRLFWRSLRVLGTQLCLMELAVANLIGFAVGTEGTDAGLRQVYNEMTTTFLLYFPFCFFCAANLAIQDRDQKAYEAAQLKLKYNLQ